MVFNGKYTFESTNASGPRRYVGTTSSQGLVYPTVSAGAVTQTERLITYEQADGSLLIQTGDLYYFSAVEEVGWIVGDPSAEQAAALKLVEAGGGQASLQIYLPDVRRWLPVRYSVNVQLPYLVFPLAGTDGAADEDACYNFAVGQITPSVAQIQASKDARGLDFRNVDLTGADLSGVDFTGADFTGATLDGTDLAGATLTDAVFLGASLNKTNVSGATLDGAKLVGCDLTTVVWGVGISCRGTDFTDCVAIGCQIGSADPNRHADFTGAHFDGADFSKSDFSYAWLKGATMLRSTFVGANLQNVDFTSAQLGGLDSTAAANLAYTYLPLVNFDKANLFGVSFIYATLYGATTTMTGTATMEQTDFSNAYLEGIDLTGAALNGAKFSNACLVNVNLTGADLTPALQGSITSALDGACLQGATFTQAQLDKADLTDATVAFSQGSLKVRYCNPLVEGPFPPPPAFEPVNYTATVGLDLTTMTAATVCPNGLTVGSNQRLGNSLQAMLTISNPATQWVPVGCTPSAGELEAGPGGVGLEARPPQVVFETPHAQLMRFSLRHFRNLRRLADDPEARRYFFWNQQLSDGRLKSLIHYYRVREKRTGITSWPAYHRADRAFVGVCGFAENREAGGIEINVAIMPEFRGDPIVKELYVGVLEYGFTRLGLELVYGMVEPDNAAAEKFVSKIGFRYVRDITVQGVVPFKLYEITRADLARQSKSGTTLTI